MPAVLLAALLTAQPAPTGCSGFGWQDACASNTGSQVDLIGEQITPPRDAAGSGGAGPGGGGAWDATPEGTPDNPYVNRQGDDCTLLGNPGQMDFNACLPDEEVPAEEDPGIPAVTAQDLASFAPQRPPLRGEPDGVGVVGMPANFVAGVTGQSLGGTLFGRAVTVRFTPVGYVFSYGDGTSQRTTTGGASWTDLGQAQFTATATSHSYGARGTYLVSVTVEYAAEVDFGVGRWFPVRGLVTASTGGYPVEIYEVRTALVERTCAENPAGPGC